MEHTPATKNGDKNKTPKFVRWAIMIGIIVVLNIFFLVARNVVLQSPQYNDYCPIQMATSTPQDPQSCSAAGGAWNDLSDQPGPGPVPAKTVPAGYCDLSAKCQPAYNAAMQNFELYAFITEIGLGVLAILIALVPLGSSIVSAGLTYGGVVAFIIAVVEFWSDGGAWVRLGASVIALAALLYIGLKRFRD